MRQARAADLRAGDWVVVGKARQVHRLVHVSVVGVNVNIVAEKQSWRVGSHDRQFTVVEGSEHGQTTG